MTQEQITKIVKKQKEYFASHATLPLIVRAEALKKLRKTLQNNEDKIAEAIRLDLGKSPFESYMCETGLVISEIGYMLKHMKQFAKDKRVRTPLAQFASKSYVKTSPYGVVLIMSPWNYPLLLTLGPLVNAIAAGNTAVLKPSAYSPNTSKIIKEIVQTVFRPEYVAVIEGGRDENTFLLDEAFDYIFFTGGKTVGKLVMKKAAEHLTPITLELGGKSPCIVDQTANLHLAAKRIVFGKFLNVGQTCVAPDYVLCDATIKQDLIAHIKKEIVVQFGNNPLDNPAYGKLINQKHFDKVLSLIPQDKVVFGGRTNPQTLQIEPTITDDVSLSDAIMQEEIFGPILPIITYENSEEMNNILAQNPHPLAFYLFSSCQKQIRKIMSQNSFGGGCVNDTIIHLATSHMGFGGVGESGMGSYHGKCGFDTFSHKKSIVDKKTWLDLPMRYQPYKKRNDKLIHMFLR